MRYEDVDKEAEITSRDYMPQPAEEKADDVRPFQEPRPDSLNLDILQNNLGNCLSIIDDEVMKGYVTKLDRLPVIMADEKLENNFQDIHFFKISELVYQEDEFSVENLAMVFQALSNKPCTLVLMLKSDGSKTDFYLGARPKGSNSAGTLFQMLKQSLIGFFPGSRISEYYDEDMKRDMQSIEVGCVSCVSCAADYKQSPDSVTNKDFIQGLEKFVYAMQGKNYTAVFIADSVGHDELMLRKREYERIYTQISPFSNMQMNFTVSDGGSSSAGSSEGSTISINHTETKGISETQTSTNTHSSGINRTVGRADIDTRTHSWNESESDGKNHTVGTSDGTSRTESNGFSVGGFLSAGIGGVSAGFQHSVADGVSHTDSVSDSISKTLTHGFGSSKGHSHSISNTYGTNESDSVSGSRGIGTTQSRADTAGEAFNLVNTKTITDTFGTSKGITLNAQNMTLNLALQKIQKHLERIEECESFGMWNFAAYFLGETAAETETAANTYKSVIVGNDSRIERSAINSWVEESAVKELSAYIKNFTHPQFAYRGFSYEEERYVAVDPSILVSTNELAIHMGLPRHSVRGLPVVEHAPFAQEVIAKRDSGEKTINIGSIYHLGEKTDTEVDLDLKSLSMHTFITGSTGSGKSNAVYRLLAEVRRKGIPFLVIEPAKGEYKDVFTNIKCYGTNPKIGELLKINPFSFPEGIHVLEHIDRIVEIFNVCWPMYAAMPAVLKESIEQAYISAGWDLDLSENTKVDDLFPTFDDVLRELNTTIQSSDYSADTKGDYIGSLSTRIKSLTNGINGRIFVNDEMNPEDLFDKSAIIDISRVGAMETKSLIMGLVVLKLQEYRMANQAEMNSSLKHITVLEEAHNLLKKTSTEQSAESSNITGKSVEMLTNAIAEIRTFGEGFVIVDQAPNLLDTAAIRNTNTKIVLRLPESGDREITGGAIALKEPQFKELSKLPTGVAAIYQNDWQEAVLCALPKYESFDYGGRKSEDIKPIEVRKSKSRELLHLLLKRNLDEDETIRIRKMIRTANAPAKVRKDLFLNLEKRNRVFEWAAADFINKNFEFSDIFRGTSKCAGLEELYTIMRQNIEEEFGDFDEEELYAVTYFICRIEHERHPDNTAIELLRTKYLREKVMV
jgi:hypothetical protein